eukprot:gene21617-27980_t
MSAKKGTRLIDAVVAGKLNEVEELLHTAEVDVNYKDFYGKTSLDYAAEKGDATLCSLFLEKGALFEKDKGTTFLNNAADNGHTAICSLFLNKGVAIDKKTLYLAAFFGHTDTCALLIENGAKVDEQYADGTALYHAARNNHIATCALLLDKGAKIDCQQGQNEGTILHMLANYYGHEATISFLLEKGANIEAVDNSGLTALHAAVGNSDNTTFFLEKGSNIEAKDNNGWAPLHHAASKGHTDACFILLQKGADITAVTNEGKRAFVLAKERRLNDTETPQFLKAAEGGNNDSTALHWAAERGQNTACSLLLSKGANLTTVNKFENTPIDLARYNNYGGTVSFLENWTMGTALHLDNGVTADSGKSPIRNDHTPACSPPIVGKAVNEIKSADAKFLSTPAPVPAQATVAVPLATPSPIAIASVSILSSARRFFRPFLPSSRRSSSSDRLIEASRTGSINMIKEILEEGVNINYMDSNGYNALHWAARFGHASACALLLDSGAHIADKNDLGSTALHRAAVYGHTATCCLLLERGANIAAQTSFGSTALHYAANNGHTGTCSLLLEKGADMMATNEVGKTSFDLAKEHCYMETVKLFEIWNPLVSAGAKPPAPALPDKSAPSTTTLPLPHPLAEAVASPSPLSSLSAEETHLKVSEKASPASSVPMSNAPVRSGHHQGLMACKCGHILGNLPFPLKSGLIHSNGSCKWMCCNLKWSEDICPIVGAAAVPALPKAAPADLSYTSLTGKALSSPIEASISAGTVSVSEKLSGLALPTAELFAPTANTKNPFITAVEPLQPAVVTANSSTILMSVTSLPAMPQMKEFGETPRMCTAQSPPAPIDSPALPVASPTAEGYVLLSDLTEEQVLATLASLSLPSFVAPFRSNGVDGNLLNDCVESYQDLVDLDKAEIKPIFARKYFKELTAWKNDGGRVPMKLLMPPRASLSGAKSTSSTMGQSIEAASPPVARSTSASASESVDLVVHTADLITSSGHSWILDGDLTTHGDLFGDKKIAVKVKVVSFEKKSLLRHELSALKVLTGSKYFVNLQNDNLLSSAQFTVSPSGGSCDLRFDNHVAMVMEKGIITLDDHLSRHSNELSQGDFLQIITCVFNMVKDAHANNVVILDIKGSNIMLFESAKGLYIWKGIDLGGSLPVGSLLDNNTFMATVPFMAPELLRRENTPGLQAQCSMDVWSLGILIFNVLICKKFQTFWTLLGIHSDIDIKAEILSGKFTQQKVDQHIDRFFPEHTNSPARQFLQQLLRLNPSERSTLTSLQNAALLTGVASISTSNLFNTQIQLLKDLKPLNDLFTTELALFRTSLQSLLDGDKSLDLEYQSNCLASLQSLLEEQALSTTDCKSSIQNISNWQIPSGPVEDSPMFSRLMSTATMSLQNLLSAADEKKISSAQRKEL